jgi:hypothetical protein
MSKFRLGGYVFITWIGDPWPKHVHVYKDAKLVVKWDLENERAIQGKANTRLLTLIRQLKTRGKI